MTRELQTQIHQRIDANEMQALAPGQAWASNVLVPLTQNILGGAASTGLALIIWTAWTGGQPNETIMLWCGLIGGALACAATLTRFFSDDLGLLAKAYHLGQESMQAQISALELELRSATDAVNAVEADGSLSAARKQNEYILRANKDAVKIVEIHFQGDSIARSAMATRGMGQRDWERASRLLKAAGVVNGDGAVQVRNARQALRLLDQQVQADSGRGEAYNPAWK